MPRFESGVASYVVGEAKVKNYFPVDAKGNADISCTQCFFYREASRRCSLTGEISSYPTRYVGMNCPLEMVEQGEQT